MLELASKQKNGYIEKVYKDYSHATAIIYSATKGFIVIYAACERTLISNNTLPLGEE